MPFTLCAETPCSVHCKNHIRWSKKMKHSFLDAIFLVIILLPAIICSIKGFIKEVFGMGALVLGIWAAALFYKLLTPFLSNYIHVQFLAIALSFLIIFLVV